MSFSLLTLIDQHITRSGLGLPRANSYYPSEASVVWVEDGVQHIEGGCLRRTYFRCVGQGATDTAPNPYLAWMGLQGKGIENIITEQLKEMGLWVTNNEKFYYAEYNISGEIDIVIRDPETGELVILEQKSMHGYMANSLIGGTKYKKGRPKTNHLLQLLLYLHILQHKFRYGKLIYKARDDDTRAEFDIRINHSTGKHYIDNEVDQRFTVQDALDRYRLLDSYVQRKEMPPREYEEVWSPDKVEALYKVGEVSKSKYEKWSKNPDKNPIGDWLCRSCPYCSLCRTIKS